MLNASDFTRKGTDGCRKRSELHTSTYVPSRMTVTKNWFGRERNTNQALQSMQQWKARSETSDPLLEI